MADHRLGRQGVRSWGRVRGQGGSQELQGQGGSQGQKEGSQGQRRGLLGRGVRWEGRGLGGSQGLHLGRGDSRGQQEGGTHLQQQTTPRLEHKLLGCTIYKERKSSVCWKAKGPIHIS